MSLNSNYEQKTFFYNAESLAKKWNTTPETVNYLSWDRGLLRPALISNLSFSNKNKFQLWLDSDMLSSSRVDNYIIDDDEKYQFSRRDVMYINTKALFTPFVDSSIGFAIPHIANKTLSERELKHPKMRVHKFETFEGKSITLLHNFRFTHSDIDNAENLRYEEEIYRATGGLFFKPDERQEIQLYENEVIEFSKYFKLPVAINPEHLDTFFTYEEVQRYEELFNKDNIIDKPTEDQHINKEYWFYKDKLIESRQFTEHSLNAQEAHKKNKDFTGSPHEMWQMYYAKAKDDDVKSFEMIGRDIQIDSLDKPLEKDIFKKLISKYEGVYTRQYKQD